MSNWYRFHFFDPDRPQGERFLGACIVKGESQMNALERSWHLSCNPGGQAEGEEMAEPPDRFTNVPLQRPQLEELTKLRDFECPF